MVAVPFAIVGSLMAERVPANLLKGMFASMGHIYRFATNADPTMLQEVGAIVIFTIPGVVLGGQIGPRLQSRVDPDVMKIAISVMFVAVGGFMFLTILR
jgi:uncharacterized protein